MPEEESGTNSIQQPVQVPEQNIPRPNTQSGFETLGATKQEENK
jgi:hypothetical protein